MPKRNKTSKQEKAPMLNEFYNALNSYIEKYGEKTILLWQCGGFYETYALYNKETNDYDEGKFQIETLNIVCDCSIVPKSGQTFRGKPLHMAGIPTYADIERYINKLKLEGFTIVLVVEVGEDPKTRAKIREKAGIFSPGTHFNINSKAISNDIMCIWLEKREKNFLNKCPTITCGVCSVDIFTGNVKLFQYEKTGNNLHNPTSFDELERFFSIHKPKELIFIHNYGNDGDIDDIMQYAGLYCDKTYKISLLQSELELEKQAQAFTKQTYQQEILHKFYKIKDYSAFLETTQLREYLFACQSFCFLLDFIYSHNPNLVYNIHQPIFENNSKHMILANHSLHQLNVIETEQDKGCYSSVQKHLNKCMTPMGRRKFNDLLLHPTTNTKQLNKEYDIVEVVLNDFDKYSDLRNELHKIRDIERLYRKIILKKVFPCELAQFYRNMESVLKIDVFLSKNKSIKKYFKSFLKSSIKKNCKKPMSFLKKHLNMEETLKINSLKGEKNFFNRDIYKFLDKADRELMETNQQLIVLQEYFSNIIRQDNGQKKSNGMLIRQHATEKSGVYLEITTKRNNIFKEKIKTLKKVQFKYTSDYTGKEVEFAFDFNTIKFGSGTSGNKKIEGSDLQKIYYKLLQMSDNLKEILNGTYNQFICKLQEYNEEMDYFVKYVSILDVLINKAYIAKKYNYCKPQIEKENHGFLKASDLRHPLIEYIQQNELYVPNSVELGREKSGILLYGTNAVGKSSLIRSIGIAVIMAQAGLFVPCSQFVYHPYKSIYTRILGNDNIFKCLSTFAVEMCEMTTILKNSDKYSLILGDELCSGTEMGSAISIFISGLEHLQKIDASHIFATHFHELTNMEEIADLKKLAMKHMTVECDENGVLIYDRILRDGPGNNMYGLEVCKSLDMPVDFLNRAHEIRRKRFPQEESIFKQFKSRYNNKILKGVCQLCKKNMGQDIHHLNPQEHADKNGFIGNFHKNHSANLLNVCKKCHLNVTKENIVHKKTKTSEGMKLLELV